MSATAAVLSHSALPVGDEADLYRIEASKRLAREARAALGQFFTPPDVARFMAALFERITGDARLLDAGAGVGSLLAATIDEACERPDRPSSIEAVGFEIDGVLARYLRRTILACGSRCAETGVRFEGHVVCSDFIEAAVSILDAGLFGHGTKRFSHVILNPPYHKLSSDSRARLLLRRAGIETSNLYTGFVALAVQLLEPGGEMVAITPRSFCNGPYFRPFRELLLGTAALRHVHLFTSRTAAFSDDDVLQENVILHVVKSRHQGNVLVSSSEGPSDDLLSIRDVPFEHIVHEGDPELFIHLVPDDAGQSVADSFARLPCALPEIGVEVSTGKVVDFRAKPFLREGPGDRTKPLIYPTHFDDGVVKWPKEGKKPNGLVDAPATAGLWMPSGTYVLTKRFSSKEERRRLVAAVFDPAAVVTDKVGFENHLNVFHQRGEGLDPVVARGLAAFLNSTFVDTYFRQFSGHTQVNATDLRNLRYPSRTTLEALGRKIGTRRCSQRELDDEVETLLCLASAGSGTDMRRKVEEALSVLEELGFPRQQQNERSALTLLALLGLKPKQPWSEAGAPLVGITPMMDFMSKHYGKTYAPNSRETVRRRTIHQFRDAGLVVANPDDPARPVNSDKTVYQIEARALETLRSFGAVRWEKRLRAYLAELGTLADRYARGREMARIPVTLPNGQTLKLTPGGQNELVKSVVEELCPRFAPGGHVVYVGDTGNKLAMSTKPR